MFRYTVAGPRSRPPALEKSPKFDEVGENYPVPEIGEVARSMRCGNLGADVSAATRAMR
jgi:hypothetical protein